MRTRALYTPLRRRADFGLVHTKGKRKGDALLQVRALPSPASVVVSTPIRLGIIVSKKFGSAVERNRFKRIVRAAVRNLGVELHPGWDILILPRAAHEAKMPAVRDALRCLLTAIGALTPGADNESGQEATQG